MNKREDGGGGDCYVKWLRRSKMCSHAPGEAGGGTKTGPKTWNMKPDTGTGFKVTNGARGNGGGGKNATRSRDVDPPSGEEGKNPLGLTKESCM